MSIKFRVPAAQLLVAALLCLVGLLAVMQLRTQIRVVNSVKTRSTSDQAMIISKLVDGNGVLRQTVDKLEEQINRYQSTSEEERLAAMVGDLNRLKILDGSAEVNGEGVEVTVSGRIGASAMQDILNEVRNAGAEAVALNNLRMVDRSVIGSDGSGLLLDGQRLTAPYVLSVIGPSQTMERALERKGGLLQLLRFNDPTLNITVGINQSIVVPMYDKEVKFNYAKPVKS